MDYEQQLKLERRIVAAIAIASIVAGFIFGHMEGCVMVIILQFIGACVVVGIAGYLLATLLDDTREMDEAERRNKGMLLQDEMQAAALLRKYNECRERMGRDCCISPDYQFKEKHRLVTGEKK